MTSRVGSPRRCGVGWPLLLRLYLTEFAAPLGLLLPLAVFVAFATAILVIFHSSGPGEPVTGVVRSIAPTEARGARPLMAVVDFPGGSTTVGLDWPTTCQVGQPIRLIRTRLRWGSVLLGATIPCPTPQRPPHAS